MYSPRLVDALNALARLYGEKIKHAVTEVLSQPRYTNTGVGVQSVAVTIIDGDTSKSPVIQIVFDDHVKLMDKRKMQWTQLPDMKKMLEWAATKESDPKAIKYLAWATAWKQKNFDTWKPKAWRKKSLSAVLKELNQEMLKAFDEAIDQDMQAAANG